MAKTKREEITEMEMAVGEELDRRAGTHSPAPTLSDLPDLAAAIEKIDEALPGMVEQLLYDFDEGSPKDRVQIMKLLLQASLSSDRLKQAMGLVKGAAKEADAGGNTIFQILNIDVDTMRQVGPEGVAKLVEGELADAGS